VSGLPLIDHDTGERSVFEPGNLLDGARRQKGLPQGRVPAGCLLDMDGELVDRLLASGRASLDAAWPCFHTRLYRWTTGEGEVGVVGGTVGAPFAVLVAEELFASGCEALVTIASAGLVASDAPPPEARGWPRVDVRSVHQHRGGAAEPEARRVLRRRHLDDLDARARIERREDVADERDGPFPVAAA
jgi:hypothetical protein